MKTRPPKEGERFWIEGVGLLTIYFRPMEPRWRQTLRG